MNIFFTSLNPDDCAVALDDKRLNKMILETAQLLSNAARHYIDTQLPDFQHLDLPNLYKRTHWNHPSSVWARTDTAHFVWLVDHFYHLAKEKQQRDIAKGKPHTWHLSFHKLNRLFDALIDALAVSPLIPDLTQTDLVTAVAVDADLKALPPIEAYRKHMARKWLSDANPTWGHRKPPVWFIELTQGVDTYSTNKE